MPPVRLTDFPGESPANGKLSRMTRRGLGFSSIYLFSWGLESDVLEVEASLSRASILVSMIRLRKTIAGSSEGT